MEWRIASSALDRIRTLAADTPDHEVCGLLLADGSVVPAANIATDPARYFELDPAALFAAHRHARQGGPTIVGHYHSHPAGPARPSPADAAMALEPGGLWLIVTPAGDATLWRVAAPGRLEPAPLVVA